MCAFSNEDKDAGLGSKKGFRCFLMGSTEGVLRVILVPKSVRSRGQEEYYDKTGAL